MEFPIGRASGVRRGVSSGLAALALLALATFPGRLAAEMRESNSIADKVLRSLAGALLDLSAVVLLLAPLVTVLTLVVPLVVARARGSAWQRFGAFVCAYPLGFLLWVLGVVAQEMKSERGSFPTMFDLLEGGRSASFLEGALGFIRYKRVWFPAAAGAGLLLLVLVALWLFTRNAARGRGEVVPYTPWAYALPASMLLGSAGVVVVVLAFGALTPQLSAPALGDPMSGLLESAADLLRNRGPATPRDLVLTTELPAADVAIGAALLGWPATTPGGPHPHARPLDLAAVPLTHDLRGTALVQAFQKIGEALFTDDDRKTAVFQLSLEGFRADDVHALNPDAPREIAPFTSSLYEGREGVLTSTKMFQGGVRTAQGLGAMTCGLGTLPYNLSFIRDLHPFPVRCVSDLLSAAGFRHSFYYGSDGTFDGVGVFLKEHGYSRIVTQAELPPHLPIGTWHGVTDFALFDEALRQEAQWEPLEPQFTLMMSLSNHSPFTPPEDLPASVSARVDHALSTSFNRANADDRLRLVTYSYTDAALEHLFAGLSATGLAERSIVLLMADHSTGHPYLWNRDPRETEVAKARIPFALVIPKEFLQRAKSPTALASAMKEAQALIEVAPLSQNDVPTLLLALMSAHPLMKALPRAERWHTLGGQVTSPWFVPASDPAASILGINGKSEFFALNRSGDAVGDDEASVFLKTRADRYRVTPRLIPITATLKETMGDAAGPSGPRSAP